MSSGEPPTLGAWVRAARRAQLGWLGVIALIFFATSAPETNGRSLEEIEQQLQRKRLGKIWGRDDAPAVVTASARTPKGAGE